MTFKELKEKAKGLTIAPETKDLKHQLFAPFFKNLYEDKLIYESRGRCCLIKADNIETTPENFTIKAVVIEDLSASDIWNNSNKNLEFTTSWILLLMSQETGEFLFPYASYSIWIEKETIQHVEKLIAENRKDEIYDFLHQNKNT